MVCPSQATVQNRRPRLLKRGAAPQAGNRARKTLRPWYWEGHEPECRSGTSTKNRCCDTVRFLHFFRVFSSSYVLPWPRPGCPAASPMKIPSPHRPLSCTTETAITNSKHTHLSCTTNNKWGPIIFTIGPYLYYINVL